MPRRLRVGAAALLLALAAGLAAQTPPVSSPIPAPAAASPSPAPSAVPAPPSNHPPAAPPARVPHPAVPVGTFLPDGAVLRLFASNQVGLAGRELAVPPRFAVAGLADPGPAGQARVADLLAAATAGADAGTERWLVRLAGSRAGGAASWEWLARRTDAGFQLDSFTARSLQPGGGVSREERWEGGALASAVDNDEAGRPLTEFWYDRAGAVASRVDYALRDGRVALAVRRGADGAVAETARYAYTLDGRVRQTERWLPGGVRERYQYRYADGSLAGAWDSSGDAVRRWRFDAAGRLMLEEETLGGKLTRSVQVVWASAEGAAMASRETTEPDGQRRTVEVFDERGRAVQVDRYEGDELVDRTSQEWDADGRLVLRNSVGTAGSESLTIERDAEGRTVERYAKNGLPVRVVTREPGGDWFEEIYVNGEPRLRAWYRDGTKYKEEDIRNGSVIRTRSFEGR